MMIGARWRGHCRWVGGLVLAGSLLVLGAFPALAGARSPTGSGTLPKLAPPIAAAPPMGWDSWDTFGCGVSERELEQVADWMVASGMRDAGYRYVIVDDCWYAPTRSADGSLRADPKRFPSGMRALGRYLHARGLLFGIYETPGASTCAQLNQLYPGSTGSLGHERQDAQTFASWGVDYLKYDWCSSAGSLQDQITAFTKMRDALRASGRAIVYSINPNSFHSPTGASYNWSKIANLVRTGPDIAPFWDTTPLQWWFVGIDNAIGIDIPLWGHAGPGHWNDPDTLVVGVEAKGFVAAVGALGLESLLTPPRDVEHSITFEEMRTNFAMWAMLAAPLITSNDVRYMFGGVRQILLNPWLIQIDQDPLGVQGRPVDTSGQVWAKPLAGGTVAAALLNESDDAMRITATASELGLPAAKRYDTRNVWTGNQSSTAGALHYLVPAHGVVVYLVTAVAPQHGK